MNGQEAADLFTALRILAVPVLYVLAWSQALALFRIIFPLAVVTDALDGWLARRSQRATLRGRYLDSIADAIFYTSVPLWFWWLRPDVTRGWWPWILPAALCYLAGVAVKIARRRPIAALHLETTRVAGGVTMIYLTWILWGAPATGVKYIVVLLLAFAAAVELLEALRLPVS